MWLESITVKYRSVSFWKGKLRATAKEKEEDENEEGV